MVYPGTDAAKQGLVAGDEILSIDGTSLDGLGWLAADNLLDGAVGTSKTVVYSTTDTSAPQTLSVLVDDPASRTRSESARDRRRRSVRSPAERAKFALRIRPGHENSLQELQSQRSLPSRSAASSARAAAVPAASMQPRPEAPG